MQTSRENSSSVSEKLSWRVLKVDFRIGNGGDKFADEVGAVDGDGFDLLFGSIAKGDATLQGRGRIVKVDDDARKALDRFEGAANEMLASLNKDLNGDALGNAVLRDKGAQKVEFGVGGRGKADLDLLEADGDEKVEKLQLFFDGHGDREGLISITEVDAAPDWCRFEGFAKAIAGRGGRWAGRAGIW